MQSAEAGRPSTTRAKTAAERPGWTRTGGQRVRVLIVDDHAILRQALRMLLAEEAEIEVVGDASNGREAVAATEKLMPDVVLMDMVMPGLNGLEATRQIRKRFPNTRVLILTGYMEDEQILSALRAGFCDHYISSAKSRRDLGVECHSIDTAIADTLTWFRDRAYLA